MPPEVAAERGAVLHRALRDLPLELLEPLLHGIRRHADSLLPGSLHRGDGGCAVAMMLRELDGHRRRRRGGSNTIWDERPELARKHPRLGHIEVIFDRTCRALLDERHDLLEQEVGRVVGLWMAAETQAEINLRHVEGRALPDEGPDPTAGLDPAVVADTVARLRDSRPWLDEAQAARAVRAWVGSDQPVFVPPEWEDEVELQRRRLDGPSEAVPG
jgi:hypothetical protein